jgi:hypothetical protein
MPQSGDTIKIRNALVKHKFFKFRLTGGRTSAVQQKQRCVTLESEWKRKTQKLFRAGAFYNSFTNL